jgi:hypothetical protein
VLKVLWASPASALGLVAGVALWVLGAKVQLRDGVVEVTLAGAPRRRRLFAALTLGHVVLAASAADQARLRAHERAHVAQFETWGPLLLLAYPTESLLQFVLGRRPYEDNRFERQARRRALEAQSEDRSL